MTEELNTETAGSPMWAAITRHPIMVFVLVVFTISGAIAGYFLLTGEWSALRRIVGGAIGGCGVGFLLTVSRMIGAWKGE